MNPLIKKEIHLLLPGVFVSAVAAVATCFVPYLHYSESDFSIHQFWFLFAPLLLMALSPFGREFSSGTFSLLLAQPASRERLWRIKSLSLAGMAGLISSLWGLLWVIRGAKVYHHLTGQLPTYDGNAYVWISVALGALAICSGGLWSVLLFRQVAAAFWITLLGPAGLFVIINAFLENQPSGLVNRVLGGTFLLYGISGIAFARWLFLRAQDAQWTGADRFRLPELRWLAHRGGGERRVRRPISALLGKEFRLHQVLYMMALGLCLSHFGVLAARRYCHFEPNSSVKAVLESFWVLWMALPVLVGCAAVSEERKMGTLESQLCLPVRKRTQFELKFGVSILLAVGLGMGMPLLLEGSRILPEFTRDWGLAPHENCDLALWVNFLLYLLGSISANLPWLSCIAICCGLAAIAFYASTLTRNTLEALGLAALGIPGASFLLAFAYFPEGYINYPLWRGPLICLIGVPTLVPVLAALTYWNYKRVHLGWNIWRKNLSVLALAIAMVGVSTATIYHRPWELLAPIDSAPGPARISMASPGSSPSLLRIKLQTPLRILVVLPDGRIWVNRFRSVITPILNGRLAEDPLFGGGKFIQGSDWKDAVIRGANIIAIRRDGALWQSESIEAEKRPLSLQSIKMNPIGTERSWKSLASSFPWYLLKNDGSLWSLNIVNSASNAFVPYQLGADSDWAELVRYGWRTACRKANGEVWIWSSRKENKPEIQLAKNVSLFREPAFEKKGCKQVYLFQTDHWGSLFAAGVCEDGSLREVARVYPDPNSQSGEALQSRDIQIGREKDWVEVVSSGYGAGPIVRKANGTLWKWSFKAAPDRDPGLCSASRLGTRSDWVGGAESITLAADGSLWLWNFESESYWTPGYSHSLLQQSRRPEYLGNIFGSQR